jgi:hypothetical protein
VDARAKERLVGVDVAHAGNPLLVEQKGLDRLLSSPRHGPQRVGGEVGVQRLDAEPGGEELGQGTGAEQHIAGAEAAHVDEEEAPAVVEVHPHSQVARFLGVGFVEHQVARHAQVHHEVDVVLEREHEILPSAPDALDLATARCVLDRFGWGGHRPARVAHLDRLDAPSLEGGGQLAADRLDLGKLGHAPLRF